MASGVSLSRICYDLANENMACETRSKQYQQRLYNVFNYSGATVLSEINVIIVEGNNDTRTRHANSNDILLYMFTLAILFFYGSIRTLCAAVWTHQWLYQQWIWSQTNGAWTHNKMIGLYFDTRKSCLRYTGSQPKLRLGERLGPVMKPMTF